MVRCVSENDRDLARGLTGDVQVHFQETDQQAKKETRGVQG